MPAEAGIGLHQLRVWIPACAGMTKRSARMTEGRELFGQNFFTKSLL
jgi:hypothetical protein